jgi:hypothetical protein
MIESQNDVDYVIGTSENDLILETYKKLPEEQKKHLIAYADFLLEQSKIK